MSSNKDMQLKKHIISPGYFLSGLIFLCIITVIASFISGCSTVSVFKNRLSLADDIAYNAGFKKEYIKANSFMLLTYQKVTKPSNRIRIYIEGDGSAWKTKRRLSNDPTPRQPIALYLAAEDSYSNIIYIARPGQFPQSTFTTCDPTYWSSKRFSSDVIDAFNKVIDKVKAKVGTSSIELIGYSGGGAIAVLIAARRNDVKVLRTVAGNLDHEALCEYHHVSPLEGSLNPIDYAFFISEIPQRHFVGSGDSVVPKFIARSFVERQSNESRNRITVVKGATHTKGWREHWKELLSLPPL